MVGFLFSKFLDEVALIEKAKPDWQKGLFNGVGGKIEPRETPRAAMVREFREETGVETLSDHWKFFARLQSSNSDIYFFFARAEWETLFGHFKTMTAEPVFAIRWRETGYPLVHNLPWLLRLAVDILDNGARLNSHNVTVHYDEADADLIFQLATGQVVRIQ